MDFSYKNASDYVNCIYHDRDHVNHRTLLFKKTDALTFLINHPSAKSLFTIICS